MAGASKHGDAMIIDFGETMAAIDEQMMATGFVEDTRWHARRGASMSAARRSTRPCLILFYTIQHRQPPSD